MNIDGDIELIEPEDALNGWEDVQDSALPLLEAYRAFRLRCAATSRRQVSFSHSIHVAHVLIVSATGHQTVRVHRRTGQRSFNRSLTHTSSSSIPPRPRSSLHSSRSPIVPHPMVPTSPPRLQDLQLSNLSTSMV